MGALVLALVASATPASAVAAGPPEPQEPPTEDSEGTATEETSLEVRWYGYLKLDSSWDESLIDPGNFARWVTSPSMVQEHPHFNMTARQSRLGVDLEHADGDGAPIRAKIEIDFYGGGAENKNRPQLRHAYFDLTWPNRGWTLSAGQTADVISPLSPPTRCSCTRKCRAMFVLISR